MKQTQHCPEWILNKFDEFVELSDELINQYPYMIVILMHEFMRSLYPSDPYIPYPPNIHPLDNAVNVLDRNISILTTWRDVGSYARNGVDTFCFSKDNECNDVKVETGKVYGRLWNKYPGDMVDEAKTIINERFSANDIPMDILKGKIILDAGCGSGRYSCALARLGAKKVIGLDYGDDGLNLAKKLAESKNVTNVEFKKGSLLRMPFDDEEFDFVFANGVFHHTGDIEQGTKELYRVLKTNGNAWYFIYGAGGLYWYSRKKMNILMKKIPQEYAMQVLQLIGMPMNRFIFCDNWYVPIEEHTSNEKIVEILKDIGFKDFRRAHRGRKTDFDFLVVEGSDKDRQLWGDGNLRYFLTK